MTYSSDALNYYIYVSYSQSWHIVVIGGQNSGPEVTADPRAWQIVFFISFVILTTFQRRLASKKGDRA
jgi:hypothetical protein